MFEIIWEEKALQKLYKLENKISSRIYKKVDELKLGFKSKDVKRLKIFDTFRLRVGDYRIIFDVQGEIIRILNIGHRKKIYKTK